MFGRTEERRVERKLIRNYEERMLELLPLLTSENLTTAIEIAAVPEKIRGFGVVKVANVAAAGEREMELLHRFDPVRYPKPQPNAAAPGTRLKSIPVIRANLKSSV